MNHKSVKCVFIASGDRFRLPLCNPSLESAQIFWGSIQKVKTPLEIIVYTGAHSHMATVCQGSWWIYHE